MSPEGVGNDKVPHLGQNIGTGEGLDISTFVMNHQQFIHQGGASGLPYVAVV